MKDDTRIVNGLADVKAGTAAFDDAKTSIRELLDEGPRIPDKYRQMLEANYSTLTWMVQKSEAVIGSIVRVLEEMESQS